MGRSWIIRIVVALLCIVVTIFLANTRLMKRIENTTYNLRAGVLSQRIDLHPDIVLIAIDEHSMEQAEDRVGNWPWPRETLGQIGDYVSEAKVICFDVMMSEPSPEANRLSDLFFEDFADIHQVIIPVALPLGGASDLHEPPPERFLLPGQIDKSLPEHFVVPYPGLLARDIKLGHVKSREEDGVVRRYDMMEQATEGHLLPSLALQAVMMYEGDEQPSFTKDSIRIGERSIPHQNGSFLFYEPHSYSNTYHASDILDAWEQTALNPEAIPDIKRSDFAGKIVLIGGIAEGLQDSAVVPAAGTIFGVQIHMAAIDNLLSGKPIRQPPAWVAALIIVLIIFANAIPLLNRPMGMTLWFLIFAATLVLLSVAILILSRWMIPLVPPILALLIGSSAFGTSYWQIERSRRRSHEVLEIAKQSFTDMLVHDLKNSITPIMMFVDFVKTNRGDMSNELLLKLTNEVDISSRNTLRLVENLLDIRRIEEGRLPLRQTDLPIHAVLEKQASSMIVHAQRVSKELHYQLDLSPEIRVQADKAILVRVLENLLWNAVKYSPTGSKIHVDAKEEGQHVYVTVTNRCEIIPEKTLTNLFDAFVVGPNEEDEQVLRSTGLGLAFCKLAIEEHDQHITAVSPGPGMEDGVQVRFSLQKSDETG